MDSRSREQIVREDVVAFLTHEGLTLPTGPIVDGRALHGRTEVEVRRPYDDELVGVVALADPEQVHAAIEAAANASTRARKAPAIERADVLRKVAELLDTRTGAFAAVISAETGKPISEATAEAARAGDLVRLAAFEGSQLYGSSLPLDAHRGAGLGRLGFTLREACGVVAAITPYNFPLLLVLHKLAPALAAGNAVILKPATQTPLTALMLVQAFLDGGLDPGLVQCLPGPGSTIGMALCTDERVRKVSFTGSTAVGEQIVAAAGVKRLSLELGSSCPVIVTSGSDVESAAQQVSIGGYVNAGQVCISVQRVIVEDAVRLDFVDALVDAVRQIRLGDPAEPATQVGSMISRSEASRVRSVLDDAVAAGARLETGGELNGAVLGPAVVSNVSPDSPLCREELFGPAVAVVGVSSLDEAIHVANDVEYGLAAGAFVADMGQAIRCVRELEAGSVHINSTPLWRADLMPYGGIKKSGFGKEGVRSSVMEMTEEKAVVFHS